MVYLSRPSQPVRDVPGTSPEGFLKVLTSGTSRGSSGDSQAINTKIDNLMKKSDAIVLVLQIYSCFLLEKQIFKRSKWRRPRDVYDTQLRDLPRTKWSDVLGTSAECRSYMFFKFNSQTY